jgi:hypothetical protein
LKSVNLIQSPLDCRANVEQFNNQCFERSAKICEPLGIEVNKPRISGRQIMRDNVEAESPEDYFRKSISVPFIYCTLNEMKTRFTYLHARTTVMNVLPKCGKMPSLHIQSGADPETLLTGGSVMQQYFQ